MNNFQNEAPRNYSEILCDRSLKVVHRNDDKYDDAQVLLAITHKNQCQTFERALKSAVTQSLVHSHIAKIVVLDDSSEQIWPPNITHLLKHPSITLLRGECGSPARARNLLLDWADNQPRIKWIARLDADDELHSPTSLAGLWNSVRDTKYIAVIGSNQLRQHGELLQSENIVNPNEIDSVSKVANFVIKFTSGMQKRELPSCNLMLRSKIGFRYPNIRSAEDHWLVCKLLALRHSKIAFCPYPIYSIYSLNGNDSQLNLSNNTWHIQRQRLGYMMSRCKSLTDSNQNILGIGMEGIVCLQNDDVVKEFYPWTLSDESVEKIKPLLASDIIPISNVTWKKHGKLWRYKTKYKGRVHSDRFIQQELIIIYLTRLYRAGVCTLNVKRENLIITPDGQLQCIDIGNDIQPLTTSNFRDMSARLYSIGILGNRDDEYVRRKSWRNQYEALGELDGFEHFYSELITSLVSVA